MAATNYTVFLTAQEARQNPIREKAVHDEVRGIESSILDSVKLGLYEATVSNGTPMTNSMLLVSDVWTVNTSNDELYIPNHPFSTGDTVTVSSTITLPSPLQSTAYYYVIYVDSSHIKLAPSYSDAISGRPISIDITAGLTQITITEQGSGYIQPPVVTLSGGSPTTQGTAVAYLAPYGSILSISNSTNGVGYTDQPTVQIVPLGSGATAGTISYQAVGISINNSGTNYHLGDVISVSGGTGTSASATITAVNSSGSITSISLNNPGNYTVLPTLTGAPTSVLPGGGTGATVNLTMGIKSIALTSGGTGFVAPPRVSINDPSGQNAVATANLTGGTISSITMNDPGYGYVGVSSVTFDSGSNAAAVASLQATSVQSCILDNGGSGYTSVPSVTISPDGSGAVAGTVSMKVLTATLTSRGTGYSVDDYLLVNGGVATQNAVIKVTSVDSVGRILTYFVDVGGSYTMLPGLSSNPVNGGTGTLAGFDLEMGINTITVATGGSGYVVPPNVTIQSPGASGTPAVVYANLASGSVGSFTIVNPGLGFTSIPTVTISNGSGATAVAQLTPTTMGTITVTGVGYGYSSANVTISGGGATVDATASAVIVAGYIDSINVTSPGSGYTSVPNVQIVGDGFDATAQASLTATSLSAVALTAGGSGYNSVPSITISGNAVASAQMTATGVDRIVVTNSGENYVADPTVYLIPGANQPSTPTPPVMTAQRGFSLSNIAIMSSGVGYDSAPIVNITAPQQPYGVQATANATVGAGSGTFGVRPYPNSRDYFKAWKSQPLSNEQLSRPYIERMDTVINYFTNLGYTINRITNSTTNATITWKIQW